MGNEFDRFMIVSKGSSRTADREESAVYALTATGFEDVKAPEFDGSLGGTIEVGTLGQETRVVQVLRGEVRVYDGGKSVDLLSCFGAPQRSLCFSTLRSNCGSHRIRKEFSWIGFARRAAMCPTWMRRTLIPFYSDVFTSCKSSVGDRQAVPQSFMKLRRTAMMQSTRDGGGRRLGTIASASCLIKTMQFYYPTPPVSKSLKVPLAVLPSCYLLLDFLLCVDETWNNCTDSMAI